MHLEPQKHLKVKQQQHPMLLFRSPLKFEKAHLFVGGFVFVRVFQLLATPMLC